MIFIRKMEYNRHSTPIIGVKKDYRFMQKKNSKSKQDI